jgi:TonB-dependent receptor-like protein
VTRAVLLAAVLATAASGARAQADTTRPPPPAPVPVPADTQRITDSTRRDSTVRDTLPRFTSLLPDPVLPGPLPRGTRFTFNADSFAFSDTKTVSDLLARIPGVYIARGGLYGQAEIVLYGGRGPAALEVYWDGAPYLPVGRDSVYLDPGRIPLAPLERVDVIVLPATLRVSLVTRRQASTAPITEVGISTGQYNTSGYHGAFLKRWRSGLGLSLAADWNGINGPASSSTTSFRDVDLWLKAEYVPSGKVGISYQTLSSNWNRRGNMTPRVDSLHSKRADHLVRFFLGTRADGLGPRLDLTLASATVSRDSIGNRSLLQANLELSASWSRASAAVVARVEGNRSPLILDGRAAWTPFHPITLSVDARHANYAQSRSSDRGHLAAGIALPFGFSVHGDVAWARDLQAPTLIDDSLQLTTDLSGALRWERSWATLEVGAARRDAFVPAPAFATGLRTVTQLDPTPATDYVSVHGSIRLLPGLQIAGWYFDPVRGGGAFEPPHYARYALTFYSKFWRVYRSGIFALRAEAAVESWGSGAPAGVFSDAPGEMTVLSLAGATFINVNAQIRIAGVTIFWANRNSRAFRGGYAPGVDYPRNYQFYGVVWRFTN